MVGIAQSVERLVVVQKVAGSNPVTHPRDKDSIQNESSGSSLLLIQLFLVHATGPVGQE